MIRVNQGGAPAVTVNLAAARMMHLHWPAALFTAITPATGGVATDLQGHNGAQAFTMWTRSGTPNDVYGFHKGRACVRIPAPAAPGATLQSAVNFPLVLDRGPLNSPGISPLRPFGRLQCELARSTVGGAADFQQGLVLGYRSAGVIGQAPAAGAYLFGLVGDGGGGWRWASWVAGLLVESVPLTWPGATNDFYEVDIRVYPADATQAARVELWIAGALHIRRSWGVGTLLPIPAGSVAAQILLGFSLRNALLGMPDLLIGGLRYVLSGAEDIV